MPQLSKHFVAKPLKHCPKENFKSPLLTKSNIDNLLKDTYCTDRDAYSETWSRNPNLTNSPNKVNMKMSKLIRKSLSIKLSSETLNENSDLSFCMNEPAVKNAYLEFTKHFNYSSRIGEISCSTPIDLQDDKNLNTEVDDILSEIENEMKNTCSQSSLSFSQEVLNRKDIKEAYVNHCNDLLIDEQYDFMKNFKLPEKRPKKNEERTKNNTKQNKVKKEKRLKVRSNMKHVEEHKSLQEKMALIHQSRNVGLYVLCDICNKARYLPNIKDPLDLPEEWFCNMNPDKNKNRCNDDEEIEEDEEYLIYNSFNTGSIVWAKMDGYPWWPAMVEDDPDTEDYFWLEEHVAEPTYYHVTFFDSATVTRAWLRPSCIKPFKANLYNPEYLPSKRSKFISRINFAFKQAEDAINLPLIERLKKYSFITRYTKPLTKLGLKKQEKCEIKDKKRTKKDETKEHGRNVLKKPKGQFKADLKNQYSKKDKHGKKYKRIRSIFNSTSDEN